MDMTKLQVGIGSSQLATINGDRLSDLGLVRSSKQMTLPTFMQIHGLLGSFGMLLFPVGVHLLQRRAKWSFRHHWLTQSLAVTVTAVTSLLGIWHSVSEHHSIRSVHQLLGLLLTGIYQIQICFGYLNHKHYVQYHSRARVSYMHIWIGRTGMLLGIFNVFL